jgi:hypothetical protein
MRFCVSSQSCSLVAVVTITVTVTIFSLGFGFGVCFCFDISASSATFSAKFSRRSAWSRLQAHISKQSKAKQIKVSTRM